MIHHVPASPENVRVGMFDAGFEPILTIESGDTVRVETVSGKASLFPQPGSGMTVPAALRRIAEANLPMLAPHILTGPIGVAGAEPGDMLEVRIDAVELGSDWGYNYIRPLAGALPEDFPDLTVATIPIDRETRRARLAWGMTLPVAPFFGVMGVAPPPSYACISSKEPRVHGGNMDNKELVAGSTLFLPVHVPGALFSAGDGHALQGDGEVCVTALETCLDGEFTLAVHKGGGAADPVLRFPRAETPTHYISMGFHENLDQALKQALREMIDFIRARTGLARAHAYQLCSLAVDFHVTQAVNGEKGVHGMLRREILD
ncbi:MAG: amidase [Alcaligenaceae bacterium]|nr:amidase [Alcaligenaceae bacterium SAGV5]MPS52985.1 amidase [Alcaligenaceae bacterium SAGV3]MPT56752.1 amidase [Alcaligenaceae bacterium]